VTCIWMIFVHQLTMTRRHERSRCLSRWPVAPPMALGGLCPAAEDPTREFFGRNEPFDSCDSDFRASQPDSDIAKMALASKTLGKLALLPVCNGQLNAQSPINRSIRSKRYGGGTYGIWRTTAVRWKRDRRMRLKTAFEDPALHLDSEAPGPSWSGRELVSVCGPGDRRRTRQTKRPHSARCRTESQQQKPPGTNPLFCTLTKSILPNSWG
jgi:hypothetical protein